MDYPSTSRLPTGREIVEQHRLAFKRELPSTGQKRFAPSWYGWDEAIELTEVLSKKFSLIKEIHIEKSSQVSVAEWIPQMGHAKVIKNRGKLHEYYGYSQNGGILYLYAEEALFLLESNALQLTQGHVALNVEAAHNIVLCSENGCSVAQYKVYSHLCRLGYRLRRHEPPRDPSVSIISSGDTNSEDVNYEGSQNSFPYDYLNIPDLLDYTRTESDDDIIDVFNGNGSFAFEVCREESAPRYISNWTHLVKKEILKMSVKQVEEEDDVIITHTVRTNFTDFEEWSYVPEKHFLLLTDLTGDDVEIPEHDVKDLANEDIKDILKRMPNYVNSSVLSRPDNRLVPLHTNPVRPYYKVVALGSAVREMPPPIQPIILPLKLRRKTEKIRPLVSNAPSSFKKVYSAINIFQDPPPSTSRSNIRVSYDVYLPSVSFRKSDPNLPSYRLIVGTKEEPPPFEEMLSLLELYSDKVDLLYASSNADSISFMQYFPLNLKSNCDINY